MINYKIGDTVITRKTHACGGNQWEILRTGADYKIKCTTCGHVVMLTSEKFRKVVKNVRTNATTE